MESDQVSVRKNMCIRKLLLGIIAIFIIILTSNLLHAQNLFYFSPGKFSFNLSPGWKRVPNDEVNKYMDEFLRLMKGKVKRPKYDLVFAHTKNKMSFGDPYFTIKIVNGYWNNDDIQKYIISMQNITKKVIKKEGIKEIIIDALITQPFYDPYKHILTCSIEVNLKTLNGEDDYLTGIDSYIFCKYGLVHACFYCPTDKISSYLPAFKTVLESFTFDEGYEYR